jgi:peptidyl-prolyl cis-trans isomerase C
MSSLSSSATSRWFVRIAAALLIAGVLLPLAAAQTGGATVTAGQKAPPNLDKLFAFLPKVVARYNRVEITAAQVKNALPPQLVVQLANAQVPPEEDLKKIAIQVAQLIINQKILLDACREAGYEPNLDEGELEVDRLEERIGSEKFDAGLAHQKLSRKQFIENTARQLAVNKWMQAEIVAKIDASDERLQKIYDENKKAMRTPEQVKAAHILVKVDANASAEDKEAAKKRATELRQKILDGADFSEVARLHSDCNSARNGGELGLLKHGASVPEFEEAAFALDEGEMSDVVESRFGYHIIKSGGKVDARDVSFDEAKNQLRQLLVKQEVDAALQRIIVGRRQGARIEILVP